MRVKLFTRGTSWGKTASQFDNLEADINAWLESHPDVVVERAHKLSQPTFGWGQLAVAVWYQEPGSGLPEG